jgi:hypothetical protein
VRGFFQHAHALTRTEQQVRPFLGKGQRSRATMISRGSGNQYDFIC